LQKGLQENGFVVDIANGGEDGVHMAKQNHYDLVILDVMLPRPDGFEVCKDLPNSGRQTPVLFLTARDSIQDRVKGLVLGADDYLVKPFAFSELLARVRSVLRRGPGRASDELVVGDLTIDFRKHRAERAAQRLDLTPKEFALLSLLARHAGEV